MNCPKCGSTQTKIKEYTGNLTYMGVWVHCKRCGVHTQIRDGSGLLELSVQTNDKEPTA